MVPCFSCEVCVGPTQAQCEAFSTWLWSWYVEQRRSFVWREQITPYIVFVSEVMLQQTQTKRVAEKLPIFLERFGTFNELAQATNAEILSAWQGFGYNRRALYIRDAARAIVNDFGGILPDIPDILCALPGIGPATAASICAYAYNKPALFVETNIRTVLLYVFFPTQEKVADPLLLQTMRVLVPQNNVREWYYAMTDLGVFIKKEYGNHNRRSTAYTKQSKFEGSRRQVRGGILKQLLELPNQTVEELAIALRRPPNEVSSVLSELEHEGFITLSSQALWSCFE
ncbi:MAG: hypothetical protein A2017_08970 [Lentisphaerae bacterium GWF2_44_16]|nr:MAG: hypothetical protein A2017_08970 [Lentisphaerae bacterium GWF2_44_16]